MKSSLLMFVMIYLIISCQEGKDAMIAYSIPEQDLIPEGITYSKNEASLYVSSILKKKIVKIDMKSGEVEDFIPEGLFNYRFLGLNSDEEKGQLWACANNTVDGVRRSVVMNFNLKTGELIQEYIRKDTIPATYNDLTIDDEGNVYFTDTDNHAIYVIDNVSDSARIFLQGEDLSWPNGITISDDNKYLYLASTDKGIRVIEKASGEIMSEQDTIFNSCCIDGLKYYRNSLIGIQNAVKTTEEIRIIRFFLDESGTKIMRSEIIDQRNPLFDIPTTFTIAGNELYCMANTGLGNVNYKNYSIIDSSRLKEVQILRYALD